MPHFKNTNNELFWLDEGEDSSVWLAADCVQISDEEANQIKSDAQAARAAEIESSLTYEERRAAEYPSFADQFDLLYHGGLDAWKAAIDAVKTKYPKPAQ